MKAANVQYLPNQYSYSYSCDLQDVMISIAPQSHSPGMFSWFPLFIPLANPLRVHVDDIVTVNVWRYSAFEWLPCVCVDGVIILSAVAPSTSSHSFFSYRIVLGLSMTGRSGMSGAFLHLSALLSRILVEVPPGSGSELATYCATHTHTHTRTCRDSLHLLGSNDE